MFSACSIKDTNHYNFAKNTMYEKTQNYTKYHTHSKILPPDLDQNVNQLPEIYDEIYIDESKFLAKYFKVWEISSEQILNPNAYEKAKQNAFWGVKAYQNKKQKKYFKPNGDTYSDAFFAEISQNAAEGDFGIISAHAVTLRDTFLRNSPTTKPLLDDLNNPNNNLPFDNLANSLLGINQPLFVSHFTKDGEFALVQTDSVWGWVSAKDIKIISENDENRFKNAKFITILRDKTPITASNGEKFIARIGNLFIKKDETDETFTGEILTKNGFESFQISKQNAQNFPAKIDTYNVKTSLNSILGEPYGWGGYGKFRDCSLYTKDLMAEFGIWLPRNSKSQLKIGENYELGTLSNEDKIELIKREGVPYFTLLYFPGHVMLYVGQVDGEVAIAHSIWGLRKVDDTRALIAKNALTTLKIGQNEPDIKREKLLISRINKMSILAR